MTVSYWMDKNRNKKILADVVIVGGGIAGLSTAYWLSKEDPHLKIAVVEKSQLGDGATGRNAGFITCGSVEHFNRLVGKHGEQEAHEIWKFSEDNLNLLKKHIIQDSETEIGFQHKGTFSLASTEHEFNELKNSADLMKKIDIRVEVINDLDLEKRLGVKNFVGGIKYLDDASVHPLLLLRLIKERILQNSINNVEFYEEAEVHAIETDSSGNKIVRTRVGLFEASMVVLATNGYSPLLNKYFDDKIFPTRGQILATEPVPAFMEGPCYANFVLDYFRQLPTGELIIGGFRQLQKDTELGYSDQISDIIQEALHQFIKDHIPQVASAKITHRWTGIMGFSADGQPLVGSLPDDPQIFAVGGFTGHGLGLAFHCAKKLTDVMFGRSVPKFLSMKRFGPQR
ncbi:MAG: NAD(P)/FAD-dependent oxidoreductase [Pseudobdellovibrionaceae bacterium]